MSLGYHGYKQIASTSFKKFCVNKRQQNIGTLVFRVRINKYCTVTFALSVLP